MKNTLKYKNTGIGAALLLLMVLFGCVQDPVLWTKGSDELVISDYIAAHDEYSEFGKLLESAGLNALLSVRGP
jgi:hypothetical protein